MVKRELVPTLTTFNNILYTLSRSFRFRKARGWVLQVIQEMTDIGIGMYLAFLYVCNARENIYIDHEMNIKLQRIM